MGCSDAFRLLECGESDRRRVRALYRFGLDLFQYAPLRRVAVCAGTKEICSNRPCPRCKGHIRGAEHSWIHIFSVVRNNLAKFISDFVRVVDHCNYDGASFDWEDGVDFKQLRELVVALRSALPIGKLLTATGFDTHKWISGWSEGNPATYTYLDRYNEMTYDWAGTWEPVSWFNSALHDDSSCWRAGCACWQATRQNFVNAGWPLSRINFGIPFYGYVTWGVSQPRTSTKIYSLRQITYTNLVASYPKRVSSAIFDPVAHEAWFEFAGGYITYDNPQAVTDKVEYIKTRGLGGWFIFSLNKDYMPSRNPQHPLLEAVEKTMRTRPAAPKKE